MQKIDLQIELNNQIGEIKKQSEELKSDYEKKVTNMLISRSKSFVIFKPIYTCLIKIYLKRIEYIKGTLRKIEETSNNVWSL